MARKTLTVKVVTRQNVVYEGEARAVSSTNRVGPFDILPEHINFVSMIRSRLVIHKPDGTQTSLAVENGVLVVESNVVRVFLGVTKI